MKLLILAAEKANNLSFISKTTTDTPANPLLVLPPNSSVTKLVLSHFVNHPKRPNLPLG
jgi:hypothetical protein